MYMLNLLCSFCWDLFLTKFANRIYSVLLRILNFLKVFSSHIIDLFDCMRLDGLPDVWSSVKSTDLPSAYNIYSW